MKWTKILFGSFEKTIKSQDGKLETKISVKGGVLLNVLSLVGFVALIWWLVGLLV